MLIVTSHKQPMKWTKLLLETTLIFTAPASTTSMIVSGPVSKPSYVSRNKYPRTIIARLPVWFSYNMGV